MFFVVVVFMIFVFFKQKTAYEMRISDWSSDVCSSDLSPTSEWDTAAGHSVLLAAGGRVDGPDGNPLAYGKQAFINRGFVATAGWKAPPIEIGRASLRERVCQNV